MRRFLIFIALLFSAAVFSMGNQPSGNAFIPAKLIDKEGKTHKVNSIVCDDRSYFSFKDGAVEVKVPFEKIKKIVVLSQKGDFLEVEVTFKDGNKRKFLISSDVSCSGVTAYGTVEATLQDLKEIQFLD